MGATDAGCTFAAGRRFQENFIRRCLLHLMKQTIVGGDDELFHRQLARRFDQRRGRADHIGLGNDIQRRFGVDQHLGVGMPGAQLAQPVGLEGFVHHAGAAPQQHVDAGLPLHVSAQVSVGRPNQFFAPFGQMAYQIQGDTRGDHPVGTGFHRCAGIGVDHHRPFGMLVAKGGELLGRATQIQRALGMQVRHQYPFFRIEDLGGFAHEAHARHHQGAGLALGAEASHV